MRYGPKRPVLVCGFKQTAFVAGTKGVIAIVDASDAETVGRWNWTTASSGHLYRKTPKSAGGKVIFMHHEIMGKVDGFEVDHINGDPRDNRRANLRFATKAQNQMNRVSVVSASGFKGVSRNKKGWAAAIKMTANGTKRTHHLGTFGTPEEAAHAYDKAAVAMFGEFAKTNAVIASDRRVYK
jgi:hypothetical protein